jgi:tetratricopeptide (TPR) repeat protein
LVGAPAVPVSAQRMPAANAAGPLVMRSIDDGGNYSKSDLSDLASQLRAGCTRTKVAIKPMTLAKAISNVQAQLDQYATPQERTAFLNSSFAKTAADAASLVFGALGDGSAWGAIEAALRVQQLDPNDAAPLISLAGLVAPAGMPQEALVMLDGAAKLAAKSPAPMGIDIRAVADNNRGLALLLLGYPRVATGYFQKALQRAPELSEARVNLDAAQQCAVLLPGGSTGSEPPVIADPPFWRDGDPQDVTTDDEGNPVQVASSFLDLSQQKSWTPVYIALPGSPLQAADMEDYYNTLQKGIEGDAVGNAQKETQLLLKVHDPNDQTQRRRGAVWAALETAQWQPELRRLWEAYNSLYDEMDTAINIGTGEGNGGSLDPSRPRWEAMQKCQNSSDYDTCLQQVCTPQTAELFAKWKPKMAQLEDADLRYESAFWKYAMAVAANISDPADHQRIVLDATDSMLVRRDNDLGLIKLFFESSEWWGGATEECDGGVKPPPPETTVPGQEDSEACPKALNVVPPVEVHEIFGFKMTCEEVELTVKTPGFLGGFLSVSFTKGGATAFLGGYAGGFGNEAKEGAFVSLGPGGVQDAGMRISESTYTGTWQSHAVNFSVAGTVPFSE